jgi:hypothetical protein
VVAEGVDAGVVAGVAEALGAADEGVDGVDGFVFGVGRTGSCTPGLSSAGLPVLSM